MIPAKFDYARPATLVEAHGLIAQRAAGADVAVLSGGQSLLTAMKLRKRRPELVLDIGSIAELSDGVEPSAKGLRVGARMRQTDFAEQRLTAERAPIFRQTHAAAADPMVRRRGTLVGAFCECDPFGDWVPAGLVHEVELELVGPAGVRRVALEGFAALSPEKRLARGEIACAAEIAAAPPGARSLYRKAKHNAIGWSIAGVAVLASRKPDGSVEEIRLAAAGALARPQRLRGLEAALSGVDPQDAATVKTEVERHCGALDFVGDRYASADYRALRLMVEIRRALAELAELAV